MHKNKLVVVGVGHVGSYVLADAMKLRLFAEIATIDILQGVSQGEALDQAHATALTYMSNVDVHAGDYSDCADADVIIVAAGPSILKDDNNPDAMPDRASLTGKNAEVIREVMAGISKFTKEAIVILITNPLDTMTYIAASEFDYPEGRVFGTGTMLDSARLRKVVSQHYGIDPKSVTGYMMGEHGMTAFPVMSRLNINGIRYDEFGTYFPEVEPLDPEEVGAAVVKAAYDVLNGKGWTNAGVAQAAITLAQAVLLDEKSVYPVCTILRGQYGHDGDVALSMPCLIGRDGVEKQYGVSLDEWETAKMNASIDYIQLAMKDAKTGPFKG